MSASDKKKLRKEQNAAFLSEKQKQEQAEAKKLRTYTISFVAMLALVLCVALVVLGVRAVNQSGVFQRNTIAGTVGDRELNTVELSYYYNDAISNYYNEWYSQYGEYTDSLIGFDPSKPLDKQIQDSATGKTWATYFVELALDEAKSDYALYDLAKAEGYTLPEDQQTELDNMLTSMSTYASIYGYRNENQYLRAMYGYGSDLESYQAYVERGTIAAAFKGAHLEGLTYDDAAIREHEKADPSKYNSYSYSSVYMSYTEFREGGTEDENGNVTYSDKENTDAREALRVAAEQLATVKTLDELKEQVKTIKVNKDSQLAVNAYTNELHTDINAALVNWLNAEERKQGDIAAVPNTSTVTDKDGKDTTVVNGYYVVYFDSKTDNTEPMGNVRHLLVQFTGGTEDPDTGVKTYSDAEKAKAKEAAEGYLKTWQEGDATEDSFIALVKEHSDDTSAEEGGLFEDIHPDSSYVLPFRDWATDPKREKGDAEVIETEFGYHVMYYVSDDELSYRDYMITEELRKEEHEKWYEDLLKPITTATKDLSKMNLDLILSTGA